MKPVFYLSPDDLAPHPLLQRIGILPDLIAREQKCGRKSGSNREAHQDRAAELSGEFQALVDDIATRGVQKPLEVCKGQDGGWLIADGRNRWEAFRAAVEGDAEAADWLATEGLPCIEIAVEDVPAVILSAMARRHLTKAARALAGVMVHPEVAEDAQRGGDRRSIPKNYGLIGSGITQADLAKMVGVSLATMEAACAFWRDVQLKRKDSDRAEMLNQVFAGISFANVQIGAMGKEATKDSTRKPTQPAFLLVKAARSMGKQFSSYDALPREMQVRFLSDLDAAFRVAPKEVREHLAQMLADWDKAQHSNP